jgi:hypothetical protein
MRSSRDGHLLLQSRAAIAARGAVDLNRPCHSLMSEFCARHGNGRASDLHHIADLRSQARQIGGRNTRDRVANVFDASFGNS